MGDLPDEIRDEQQLDEVLSRPYPALTELMKRLDGDVMILGAGGKVGPTLARVASRAADAAGTRRQVIAVDRGPLDGLAGEGVRTIICDVLDPAAVERLPKATNIIYMVGRKFGSTGGEPFTWATNAAAAYHVARTFTGARVVVFSTGCVYPLMDVAGGGATEATPVQPLGEYAMSCLGRERMFDYFAATAGEKVLHVRLNYAVELRYGVLVDVALKVWRGEPVDVTTGYANVLWQGDVVNRALLCLPLASSPATVLNVTGPETISVRRTAETFGERFGKKAILSGRENGRAYLSNAARANELFGPPSVPAARAIEWTASWIRRGRRTLGKPTHFETQDGRY